MLMILKYAHVHGHVSSILREQIHFHTQQLSVTCLESFPTWSQTNPDEHRLVTQWAQGHIDAWLGDSQIERSSNPSIATVNATSNSNGSNSNEHDVSTDSMAPLIFLISDNE